MAAGGVLVGRGYVSIRPEFEGDWSRQVGARASSAGRSGGGAFSKAFGTAVSGGLRGIVGGFGASLAAGIAPAGAAVAALAPAFATAGAAAGALKLGLSGVGEALKAAFADTSADASKAASATKAVESAQRGLANAQRGLADARVAAARQIADAQRGVEDAERDLTDAQRNARDVQADLNDARREAARSLEDMNNRLAESRLNEREAVQRQQEAEKELKAAQAKKGTTPEEIARLQLAYDRATLNLKEQRTETQRLSEDTAKANKAGIEGSQQVLQAKEKISEANRTVADKERALGEAQAAVDRARQDGQRQIADAQRQVADAARAVAEAQAAAAAQTSQLDQAMSKLAPNARSFVGAVQGLAPAWDSMRLSVQQALFQGLDGTVKTLAGATIPVLQKRLTETAGIWNEIAKNAAGAVTDMTKSGMLDQILKGANQNLQVFKDTPRQLITAFGQLTVAAQPAFNQLLQGFAGAITHFTDGLAASFTSGGLKQAIDTAFGLISQLGSILGDAAGAVTNILKAAGNAGGAALGVVGALFDQIRQVTEMPEIQAALRTVFESIARIVGALAPVIGAILQAAVPLVAAIASVAAQLAEIIGPVLQQIVTALGQALAPIIDALGPVVTMIGQALADIVSALVPLLEPIGRLIGAIVGALRPVLKPVIDLVVQLVDALVGPLNDVISALIPYVETLGQLFGSVFGALGPLITPLVGLVGQLVQVFADLYTTWIQTVIQALVPLIGPLTDLVSLVAGLAVQVLQALMPSLDKLIQAAMGLLVAILPILPQMAELTGLLLELAVNVLAVVLPPLIQLAGFLVSVLATGLATVIGWVASLVTWVTRNLGPAFRWLGDKVVEPVWRGIQSAIKWAWDRVIRPTFTALNSGMSGVAGAMKWARDKVIVPVWTGISGAINTVWTKGIRPAFDALKTAIGRVATAFDDAKTAIGKAWDKIKGLTKDPINWVLRVVWNEGIVSVWKRISGWVPHLPELKTLPLLAQGGTVPAQPGVFNRPTAIVGEGNPAYPEYVIPTDPKYRRRALSLYESAGTQLLAGGGILGGLKNLGGRLGDIFSSAGSFLKDPGKALEKMLGKLIEPLDSIKGTAWGQLAIGLPKTIFKGLVELVTGGGSDGGGSIGGTIPTGQRRSIISQALAAAHVPPPGTLGQWLAGMNTLITRESGWNPRAINLTDINARRGIPSKGLAQVIGPTFKANHVPGTSWDIYNPVANVAASIRYITRRYGNITRVQQANANRPPAGYDAGGWLQPGYTLAYNGTGRPEPVLTGAQWNAVMGGGAEQQPVVVEVHTKDQALADFIDVRVHHNNRQIVTALRARPRG